MEIFHIKGGSYMAEITKLAVGGRAAKAMHPNLHKHWGNIRIYSKLPICRLQNLSILVSF